MSRIQEIRKIDVLSLLSHCNDTAPNAVELADNGRDAVRCARAVAAVLGIVSIAFLQIGCIADSGPRPAASTRTERAEPAREANPKARGSALDSLDADVVTRVVDGDTVILERIGRARLIGVDTPESVDPRAPVQRFSKEASEFTTRLVAGRAVRVGYDWNRTDRYRRTLVYLYLMDGTFVNAEIIRQGYGFAYTQFPFKYSDDFTKAEREARQQMRGLWAAESPSPVPRPTR